MAVAPWLGFWRVGRRMSGSPTNQQSQMKSEPPISSDPFIGPARVNSDNKITLITDNKFIVKHSSISLK